MLAKMLSSLGWSPYDLARAVNQRLDGRRRIHPTTPFTWRDYGVVPRGPMPSLVAGVLTEATGRVVTAQELWPQLPSAAGTYRPASDGFDAAPTSRNSVALLGADPAPGIPPGRRFFAVSGTALVELAAAWQRAVPELLPPRPSGAGAVTHELVDYLAQDAAALRRLDDGHGGALVRQVASHQLGLTIELLSHSGYSAREGRALASVVAQLAQLTGWLHFDLGEHGPAQRGYLIALRTAGLAGDRPLEAMILSALATQQIWRHHPQDGAALLDLAAAVLPNSASPRVRAILAMRHARAHALTGNAQAATAALHHAEHDLDLSAGPPTPVWAYWLTPAVFAGETGRTLFALGQHASAIRQLEQAVGTLDEHAVRDRILYGLSLARARTAHLHGAGEVEQACHEATQVLPLMDRVGSARCRALLHDLLETLSGHRTRCVHELREQATPILSAQDR
jgi:tetratricopeptide (TPR) repeat protein